jgi:hypothetical protein
MTASSCAGVVSVKHPDSTRIQADCPRGTASQARREKTLESLAKDLRTETSLTTITKRLKVLKIALSDPQTSDNDAVVFVRAGGLPAVIRHLGGLAPSGATCGSDVTFSARAALAGDTMTKLLLSKAVMADFSSQTDVVPLLIGVLRNTSSFMARSQAAQGLMLIADSQPAWCRGMAEEGIVGLVLDVYVTFRAQPLSTAASAFVEPSLELAHILVCSERAALEDLGRGIQTLKKTKCFGALLILKVS